MRKLQAQVTELQKKKGSSDQAPTTEELRALYAVIVAIGMPSDRDCHLAQAYIDRVCLARDLDQEDLQRAGTLQG